MKIFLNTAAVLLLSMIWLGQVQTQSMDHRYPLRGPPRPPRPPPLPQYIKKWEQLRPTRNANRPRPIPMEQVAVVPIFMPPPVGPPIVPTPAPPPGLGNYWKTTKAPYRQIQENPFQISPEKVFQNVPEKQFPMIQQRPYQGVQERPFQTQFEKPYQAVQQKPYQVLQQKSYQVVQQKPYQAVQQKPYQAIQQKPYQAIQQKPYQKVPDQPYQIIPEKPFQSSPAINRVHEYDYHIQSNSIPTHSITIKQVDEKGPIHTIPAPNLSLADKPIVVEEVYTEAKIRPPHSHQSHVQNQKSSHKSHQYQVTEPNEVFVKNTQKIFRDPQKVSFPSDVYSNSQVQNQENAQQLNKQPQPEPPGNQLNEKELLQLINSHLQQQDQQQQQQQQQQVFDNYGAPILPQALVQQPYQQQQPQEISYADYQAMLSQSQLFQPDPPYLNQIQQILANQNFKDNQQAQYQSFGYERHAQNGFSDNDQPSTFISTNYNLKAEGPDSAPQDQSQSESNLPYAQEIFDLEESEANSNNVEQKSQLENKSNEEEDNGPVFYTTLPNREAAETLASLQAAGKVNSNIKQTNQQGKTATTDHRTPLEIYVPDSQQYKDEPREETRVEYSISSFKQEVKNEQSNSSQQENQDFGSKIRPKQKQ